ncbi:hypothetical protein ACFLU6_16265, partial [Acidobacteriota bacterium]
MNSAPAVPEQTTRSPSIVQRGLHALIRDMWRWVLLLIFLLPAYDFLRVSLGRVTYPYEVEWMEGEIALHAMRFLEKPSLIHLYPHYENSDFVPWLYAPFYQILLAGLYGMFDSVHLGFGRLLSMLATLGIVAGIAAIVHSQTRRWFPALLGALSYLWFFKVSGYWYDIVRVDSLAYCLTMWAAYFIIARPERKWKPAAGLSLALLAAFTKQTALFIPGAVLAIAVFFRIAGPLLRCGSIRLNLLKPYVRFLPRRNLSLPVIIAFLPLVIILVLLFRSDPFKPMIFYLYEGPSRHTMVWDRIPAQSIQELWQHYSFAAWIVPFSLWLAVLARKWKKSWMPWVLSLLGMLSAGGFYLFINAWRRTDQAALSALMQKNPGLLSGTTARYVAAHWSEPVLIAAAFTVGGLILWALRWIIYKTPLKGIQWLFVLFAAQHIAIATRIKIGAWVNSYMALFAVQAVVLGISLA